MALLMHLGVFVAAFSGASVELFETVAVSYAIAGMNFKFWIGDELVRSKG